MDNSSVSEVWVFHGDGGRFGSGVFSNLDMAEEWIKKYQLTGLLTLYPINIGVYDWSIKNGFFEIKNEKQTTPQFIQGFTTASQDHFHYEDGEKA